MKRTLLRHAAIAAALATSTMLSGCLYHGMSQAPIATTYLYSEQQRMQAAHHWDVLARHEADGILRSERVRSLQLHLPEPEPAGRSQGEFAQGYHALLTSQLLTRGALVTTEPQAGAHVTFDVTVVEHRGRGFIRPPHGALTTLAAGVAVATRPINNWSRPALALVPAAVAADVVSGSWTYTGDEEVIITTQVVEGSQIVYSSSNIYYINKGDRRHYAPPVAPVAPPAPVITVTNEW